MPGEENVAAVGDVRLRHPVEGARRSVKADRFKDQSLSNDRRQPRSEREDARTLGGGQGRAADGGGGQARRRGHGPAGEVAQRRPDKLYFTRLSRDMQRLDVCVADTATGEVKPIIEERLNTYIESKPLRLVNNGAGAALLVGARRLGPLLSVRREHRRAEEPRSPKGSS